MLTITIDEKSISAVLAGQLDLEIFVTGLTIPKSNKEVKAVEIGDHGYILSRQMQPSDALLTISLAEDGPIASLLDAARYEAFGRILKCTMRLINGRTRSIPVAWRPFHYKNRLSFQADRLLRSSGGGKTESGRIIMELTHETGPRVFAFMLDTEGRHDISVVLPNLDLFFSALSRIAEAISKPEAFEVVDKLGENVSLDAELPNCLFSQGSLDDWYKVRFTKKQRQFVDYPLTGSARLVGPAGSGKTLALVVKCLKHLIFDNNSLRILFLTHASSTANEIENIVMGMHPDGVRLLASVRPSLVVTTLYSLANNQMRYDLDELTPVSLDGYEGRSFQAEIVNIVIEKFKSGDWIAYKSGCSTPFVSYMEANPDSVERRFFLWELLNEFACVLDAEGVKSDTARREQYLGEKRKTWMMVLPKREEREVVLKIYDGFRAYLRELRAIGSDQMIVDFLNYLDSFRWEATREQEGYDLVFVDELHLFNRQERMIFRHLLRKSDAPPTVFLAYDAKQSPRDTFLGLTTSEAQQYDFWRDAKLGKVEKIELVDVFRYTPQITKALKAIDQAFPGHDLDEDWPVYSGISQIDNGPVPIMCALDSTFVTYGAVFKRAKSIQRKLGRSKKVAVLCVSNDLFQTYLQFPDIRSICTPIASRDDIYGTTLIGVNFIFSMPEFVAGLQFDTVLLIEVNKSEVPDGPYSSAALRKFVSQVYLGASRAERQLEIYSSSTHGGIAPIITPAVINGAILQVQDHEIIKNKIEYVLT